MIRGHRGIFKFKMACGSDARSQNSSKSIGSPIHARVWSAGETRESELAPTERCRGSRAKSNVQLVEHANGPLLPIPPPRGAVKAACGRDACWHIAKSTDCAYSPNLWCAFAAQFVDWMTTVILTTSLLKGFFGLWADSLSASPDPNAASFSAINCCKRLPHER